MEYLVKACYLDTRTGNLHTRATKDGEILNRPRKEKHPAWLIGQRVSLENPSISLFGQVGDTDLGDKSAYIYGDIVADHPIYKTRITLKVRNGEILSLNWDGFPTCTDTPDPQGLRSLESTRQIESERWDLLFGAERTLPAAQITGTLTLTELGERYRAMGDLLRRTNYDSLYTITDVEIKGGF